MTVENDNPLSQLSVVLEPPVRMATSVAAPRIWRYLLKPRHMTVRLNISASPLNSLPMVIDPRVRTVTSVIAPRIERSL